MIHVSQFLVWGCFTESNMVRPHPSCTHKSLMFSLTELLQLCYLYLVSCWLWEDSRSAFTSRRWYYDKKCTQHVNLFYLTNWRVFKLDCGLELGVSADSCQMHVHVHYVCTYRNSLCLKKRPQCSSHLNESCYTWSPC